MSVLSITVIVNIIAPIMKEVITVPVLMDISCLMTILAVLILMNVPLSMEDVNTTVPIQMEVIIVPVSLDIYLMMMTTTVQVKLKLPMGFTKPFPYRYR